MNDTLLMAAGIGGALVALLHGYLGHKFVLPAFTGGTGPIRRVNHAVFQLSTLYWFVGGGALIASALVLNEGDRAVVVYMVSFLYLSGAVGNFWATRGRHPGWALLLLVAAMAIAGV